MNFTQEEMMKLNMQLIGIAVGLIAIGFVAGSMCSANKEEQTVFYEK
jgi:hypothetical protein